MYVRRAAKIDAVLSISIYSRTGRLSVQDTRAAERPIVQGPAIRLGRTCGMPYFQLSYYEAGV